MPRVRRRCVRLVAGVLGPEAVGEELARHRPDVVLDGIVGIGGTGGLRPAAAGVMTAVSDAGIPVVAVDLPSGVEADDGRISAIM